MRSAVFDRSGAFFVGVFFIMIFTLPIPATFFNVVNSPSTFETNVSLRIYLYCKARHSAEPSGGLHHLSNTGYISPAADFHCSCLEWYL